MLPFRVRIQLAEALGEVNRWFCSQAYGREVSDPELLWRYFIEKGGAEDFANRYRHAMSKDNRWYCSQFYRREIKDAETLWTYYMNYCPAGCGGKTPRNEPPHDADDMDIAC